MSALRGCVKVDDDGTLRPLPNAISFPMLSRGLCQYLAIVTGMRRQMHRPAVTRYASTEEFILFNAKPVRASLAAMSVLEMQSGECFHNCWKISQSHPRLRYAEGYALMCGSIPTHHAWLVDEAGGVQDPTWPSVYRRHAERQPQRHWSGRAVYMGIAIEQEAHRRWVARHSLEPMLLAAREMDFREVLERGTEAFA